MITITDVRCVVCCPRKVNLVAVKLMTSEPGLHGLGCATFTQRYHAVVAAVEQHLKPLLVGRDADRIEELWHLMHLNGYWRGGPVLNNALGGVDAALWDLKGKRAGMPVFELWGGKVREAATVYRHASGGTLDAVEDSVRRWVQQGVRHVRVQYAPRQTGGDPGPDAGVSYGGRRVETGQPDGALPGAYFDAGCYMRDTLEALQHVRQVFGDEIELLHDVHERLTPAEVVQFARQLEAVRLFFLEDPLSPEDVGWFARLRQACGTPIAMGELFTEPSQWLPLVSGRLVDHVRMHVSDIGGPTAARKAAAVAEAFGVRTAWHGPPDLTPLGVAANLHLDLVTPNFGVQEFSGFTDAEREIFPGCPEQRGPYLYPSDRPGWGVDLDEQAAAEYRPHNQVVTWTQARRPDGGLFTP